MEELEGPTIWTDLEALNITFRHVAGHMGPKILRGNFGTRVAVQITFCHVAFSLAASVVKILEISSPIFWPQCIEKARPKFRAGTLGPADHFRSDFPGSEIFLRTAGSPDLNFLQLYFPFGFFS